MSDEMDPAARARFQEACRARGLDLRKRGVSMYASVTQLFRNLMDLPADMHVDVLSFQAQPAS